MIKKIMPLVWLFIAFFGIWKGGVLADSVNLRKTEGVLNSSQVNLINKENLSGYQIIDIRSQEKYFESYIYGSINISTDKILQSNLSLDKNIAYIITSDDLKESIMVTRFLRDSGYSVFYHQGGFEDWKEAGYSVTKNF
jgi:rhodanese-related sulfurtransferase